MLQYCTGNLGTVAPGPPHTQPCCQPRWDTPTPHSLLHNGRSRFLVSRGGLESPGRRARAESRGHSYFSAWIWGSVTLITTGPQGPPHACLTRRLAKPVSGNFLLLITLPFTPCSKSVTTSPLLAHIFYF